MGIATCQARFLGITARKADCEYKSTELAQQKLEITNQLSSVSAEYSNALNSTKLIWSNEAVGKDYGLTYRSTELAQQKLEITNQLSSVSAEYSNALNSTKLIWSNEAVGKDYGLTYSLLMMPSAINDYNPYMITTTSGAIVLNSEYAAAAKAAGISMAGGVGSSDSRDKFIAALVPGGIITQETANQLTVKDYAYEADVNKLSMAGGVGSSDSRDKFIAALVPGGIITQETANQLTVKDYAYEADVNKPGSVILSQNQPTGATGSVGWNPTAGMGAKPMDKTSVSAMQLEDLILSESIGQQKLDWTSMFVGEGQISQNEYDFNVKILQEKLDSAVEKNNNLPVGSQEDTSDSAYQTFKNHVKTKYDDPIAEEKSKAEKDQDKEKIKRLESEKAAYIATYEKQNPVKVAKYNLDSYKATSSLVKFDSIVGNLQTNDNSIKDSGFTIVENGIINHYEDELKNMTIGDLLSHNIVLMMQGNKADDMSKSVEKLLESIAKVFGYGQSGVGLNVDDASNDALKYAMEMTKRFFLNPGNAIKLLESIAKVFGYGQSGVGLNVDDASNDALKYAMEMTKRFFLNPGNAITEGSRGSDKSMTDNSAYLNATDYNRISQAKGYTAVSLSNMLSTFLTFFDNSLNGATSDYVVGKSVETSQFVTDNNSYYYIGQTDEDAPTLNEKLADFYDEIYNNICEHGWREDASLDDDEYLESMIKDGRYSMSSLNNDGYYYQTRYNETGYLSEVSDTDAITRAEAEYTRKKAELTYKEDSIDLKAKKLDAEISALSTEYDTVKSLLSKNIEKTFSMYSG